MKVLVALPADKTKAYSIDDVLSGHASCSGTDGSIIRLADFLAKAGIEVSLSATSQITSKQFQCIQHSSVIAEQFDYLIVHQSHWDGTSLTFGERALAKTYLWLQNHIHQTQVYTFLREGGYKVVCPSKDHANTYRALPGWKKKVVVIYNSYSSAFRPTHSEQTQEQPKTRLLFIGAITPAKGFIELTQIWSYLSKQRAGLELAIAGSIGLHSEDITLGATGLMDSSFETTVVQPWLNSLPDGYQPQFLGSLPPLQLQAEITKSWGVIVNPSGRVPETFCCAAVEAQACDRTVFSIRCGALPETVYQGQFNSLGKGDPVESVSQLIIYGLANKELVLKNGKLAGEFVRQKFNSQSISNAWLDLLAEDNKTGLSESWDSARSLACDLIRCSRTWTFINHYRDAEHRQIMSAYHRKGQPKNLVKI